MGGGSEPGLACCLELSEVKAAPAQAPAGTIVLSQVMGRAVLDFAITFTSKLTTI